MDNETAIKILEEQRDYDIFTRTEYRQQVHDALDCGIKALQAEPNYLNHKDIDWSMINTQADGDIITALCSLPKIISEDGQDYVQLADVLETVRRYKPSVAIPNKTGHWIEGKYKDTCDKCRCTYPKNIGFKNYCPNCGARMVEEQESEG